jgi:hypothetical protein
MDATWSETESNGPFIGSNIRVRRSVNESRLSFCGKMDPKENGGRNP